MRKVNTVLEEIRKRKHIKEVATVGQDKQIGTVTTWSSNTIPDISSKVTSLPTIDQITYSGTITANSFTALSVPVNVSECSFTVNTFIQLSDQITVLEERIRILEQTLTENQQPNKRSQSTKVDTTKSDRQIPNSKNAFDTAKGVL